MQQNEALGLFSALSWQVLEARYKYYILDAATLSDYDYDMLETRYKAIAAELGLPASACDP